MHTGQLFGRLVNGNISSSGIVCPKCVQGHTLLGGFKRLVWSLDWGMQVQGHVAVASCSLLLNWIVGRSFFGIELHRCGCC